MKGVKHRRSPSPSPEVIREGFLEEGVPELGPEVGVVPGQREHVLWDCLRGSTPLNIDFKAGSRES